MSVEMGSPFDAGAIDMGVQARAKYPAFTIDESSLKMVGGSTRIMMYAVLRHPLYSTATVVGLLGLALAENGRRRIFKSKNP